MTAVQPGDVLATRSPGLFPRLIRLAAAFIPEPLPRKGLDCMDVPPSQP